MKTLRFVLVILTLAPVCAGVGAGPRSVYGAFDTGPTASGGRETLAGRAGSMFTLESGIGPDAGRFDQNGALFGHRAYIGLDGKLGALTMGRQYHPLYPRADAADPLKDGEAGRMGNPATYSAERYDNTIQYVSPRRRGLVAGVLYSFGETPHSSSANRGYAATIGYANSLVNLSVARQRKSNFIAANGILPAVDTSARNTLLAANVSLEHSTLYAAYGHNKGKGSSPWDQSNPYGALALSMPSTDSRDVLLGMSMPYGASTLMASYIRKDDRDPANRDANQLAVGMTYMVSKQTDFYASYAKIKNRNGAGFAGADEAGRGGSAFNIALRHSF